MKMVKRIYTPVKRNRDGTYSYINDSRGKPRMYLSESSCIKFCPDKFDFIVSYTGENIVPRECFLGGELWN